MAGLQSQLIEFFPEGRPPRGYRRTGSGMGVGRSAVSRSAGRLDGVQLGAAPQALVLGRLQAGT